MKVVQNSPAAKYVLAAMFVAAAAFAACSGGGGGGGGALPNNNAPQPPPANSQSATATLAFSNVGSAQSLPSVAGITSSITLPSNNAKGGSTLSLLISTGAPAGMPAVPAKSAQSMVYFGLTASADVTLNGVPKFTMTLPSAPKSQGQFYAWSFDPKLGWTNLGTITVSGANVTFGGTSSSVKLVHGVQVFMVPFTAAPFASCPTPTPTPAPTTSPTSTPTVAPSPTPTGVASCATSGTGAIGVLCLSSHTFAFVPKGANGQNTVGQVQIDLAATPKEWSTSSGNTPTACAGDQAILKVFCISTRNNIIDVIDPVGGTESEFTDAMSSGTLDFSGGSCTICEVVIDPIDSAIIVSTIHSDGNGFYDVISTSTHKIIKSISVGPPPGMSENFGYDYFRNRIFQEPYNASSPQQIIDVASGKTYSDSVSFSTLATSLIDHNGVDIGTGIGVSSGEDGGNFFLVDLKDAVLDSPSAGMFTASTTHFDFRTEDSTFDTDCGIPITDLGVSSVNHLAFMNGEFSCPGPFVVAQLPSSAGSGPTVKDFAWATPPLVSGHGFQDGFDPHTIAVFSSPACSDCAISLDATDYKHIGVINLVKLLAAPRTSGTHQVQTTFDLTSHGVVTYFGT